MSAKRAQTAEVAALGAKSGDTKQRLTYMHGLAARVGNAALRLTMFPMLVSFGPPEAKRVMGSEYVALAAKEGDVTAAVSEIAILGAYGTGTPSPNRRRAWSFDFDGHAFYVLDLGTTGTYLFDETTGVWCEFQTQGYGLWNMRSGTRWGNDTVACDSIGPWIWKLDPSATQDEGWRRVQHIVTALIELRNRKAMRQDSLRVTASAGIIGAGDTPTLQMRFSDDFGQTWSSYYTINLVAGQYTQELAFRSLGPISAPGRVIEISDMAGPLRLDGADAEIDGLADGEQPAPPGKPGQKFGLEK